MLLSSLPHFFQLYGSKGMPELQVKSRSTIVGADIHDMEMRASHELHLENV